jgi:hypothetical protein
MNDEDHRRHKRVKLHYTVKYRSTQSGLAENWDAVTPVNMSESGICFLTMEEYVIGSGMKLLVKDPVNNEEHIFDCEVLRSQKSPVRPMFYNTVVTIEHMPGPARDMYIKMLQGFSGE